MAVQLVNPIDKIPRRAVGIVRNSLGMVAGKFLALGLGMLFWLVAATAADAQDRETGVAAAAVAATLLATQLGQRGIAQGLVLISGTTRGGERRAVVTYAVRTVAIGSVVVCAVMVVIGRLVGGDLGTIGSSIAGAALFVIAGTCGAVGTVQDQLSMTLTTSSQIVGRNTLNGALSLALVAALVVVDPSPSWRALFACWTAGSVASAWLGVLHVRRGVGYRLRRPGYYEQFEHVGRRLAAVGRRNFALIALERVPGLTLPLLITATMSAADNAVWYTVWQIAWAVLTVPVAIGTGLYASIVVDGVDGAHARRRVWHATRASLAMVAACGAGAILAAPVLLRLIGRGYADKGIGALALLVAAAVPLTIVQVYYGLCRAQERFAEASVVALLLAAAPLAGTPIVAWRGGGLYGVACVWLAAASIGGCLAALRLVRLTTPEHAEVPS